MEKKYPIDFEQSRVLYQSDFDSNLNGWLVREPEVDHYDYGKYHVKIELTDEECHSGTKCLKVTDRMKSWNGTIFDITKYMRDSITKYEAMVWVKVRDGEDPCRVHLSLQKNSSIGDIVFPEYTLWDDISQAPPYILSKFRLPVSSTEPVKEVWENRYTPGYVTDNGWVLLRGVINIIKNHYDSVHVYIETSESKSSTQDIYVDDFILLAGV